MIFKKTKISNTFIIKFLKKKDKRGFFEKQFCQKKFKKKNLNVDWKQINKSHNKKKYTFRGMHYQLKPYEEVKLVKCIKGQLIDIVFDLRKNSKTYLKSQTFQLSEKKNQFLYIPKGVAHGYLTLTDNTEVLYYHSNNYMKKFSSGINIMDNRIIFKFKKKIKTISKKDKKLKFFNEL